MTDPKCDFLIKAVNQRPFLAVVASCFCLSVAIVEMYSEKQGASSKKWHLMMQYYTRVCALTSFVA